MWGWLVSAAKMLGSKVGQSASSGLLNKVGQAAVSNVGGGIIDQLTQGQQRGGVTLPAQEREPALPPAPTGIRAGLEQAFEMAKSGQMGTQLPTAARRFTEQGAMSAENARQDQRREERLGLMSKIKQEESTHPVRDLSFGQGLDAVLVGALSGGGARGILARASDIRDTMKRQEYDRYLKERLKTVEPGSQREVDLMRALAEPEGNVGTVPERRPNFVTLTQRTGPRTAQDLIAMNPENLGQFRPFGAEYTTGYGESASRRNASIDAARHLMTENPRFQAFDTPTARLAAERKSDEDEKAWREALKGMNFKWLPVDAGDETAAAEEEGAPDDDTIGVFGAMWRAATGQDLSPEAKQLLQKYREK